MNTVLGFPVLQQFPTAITATFPVVVTIPNHGWTAGQFIIASNFVIHPSPSATGMFQLNYRQFQIRNVTTNTFELFDEFNLPVDGTNYTSFINNGLAMFTLEGPSLNIQNENVMP